MAGGSELQEMQQELEHAAERTGDAAMMQVAEQFEDEVEELTRSGGELP